MGQYYKVIILTDNKNIKEIIRMWIEPSSYGMGSKLVEHAYIDCMLLQAIEYLISPEGMFYKCRIVWAGDYADPEIETNDNLYNMTIENGTFQRPLPYNTSMYRYIVNHTKKLYVDKHRSINSNYDIHPLPLLVSEGNGNSGSDYSGRNVELCGSWARDIISVEKEIPVKYSFLTLLENIDGSFNAPNDYTELICEFDNF